MTNFDFLRQVCADLHAAAAARSGTWVSTAAGAEVKNPESIMGEEGEE